MNPKYATNNEKYPDEIDLREVSYTLISNKLTIFFIVSTFAIGSIFYSLIVDEQWTSSSLLTASSPSGIPSGGSNVSGLASLAGVNISSKNSSPPASKAVATIQSRDFLNHLLTFDGVLENLMAFEYYDPNSRTSIFSPDIYDAKNNKWLSEKPTPYQTYIVYQSLLNISIDKLTQFIRINVNHGSPIFAKEFLDLIINEVNNLSRQRDLSESEKSLSYLYDQLGKVSQSDVQIAVSQLIESQLKKQMMASVKSSYILQAIDSPFIPDLRSYPQRTKIVISWTILGIILSIMFVLIRNYVSKYFR